MTGAVSRVRRNGVPLRLCGCVDVAGDKSITHRAVLFSALGKGESRIRTTVLGRDNLASIRVMRQLGAEIEGGLSHTCAELARDESLDGFEEISGETCEIVVRGCGLEGLRAPSEILYCGNSGTTARLLCGILAGREFTATLSGDESLSRRPFRRVSEPLGRMGASFSGDMLPFAVSGGSLRGIEYVSPRASAQVKSALLLAGLQAAGETLVSEPHQSRDHTERMLQAMGCPVKSAEGDDGRWIVSLVGAENRVLEPLDLEVPGDFSSAAFLMVAASIIPGSDIEIKNVGFNPTRTGLFSILERMGARFEILSTNESAGETVVDLRVLSSGLTGCEVDARDVVLAIDEIPILAVAAAHAQGETRIRGAAELRVKESDRLSVTAELLRGFSFVVEEYDDGLSIQGNPEYVALCRQREAAQCVGEAKWRHSGDHRMAMSGAVAELSLSGKLELSDLGAVETSFPNFCQCFEGVTALGA